MRRRWPPGPRPAAPRVANVCQALRRLVRAAGDGAGGCSCYLSFAARSSVMSARLVGWRPHRFCRPKGVYVTTTRATRPRFQPPQPAPHCRQTLSSVVLGAPPPGLQGSKHRALTTSTRRRQHRRKDFSCCAKDNTAATSALACRSASSDRPRTTAHILGSTSLVTSYLQPSGIWMRVLYMFSDPGELTLHIRLREFKLATATSRNGFDKP